LPYRFFLFDPEDSRQRSDRRVESDIGSYFGKTKSVAMDSPQRKMANKTGQGGVGVGGFDSHKSGDICHSRCLLIAGDILEGRG
jgi:hypothetical protein